MPSRRWLISRMSTFTTGLNADTRKRIGNRSHQNTGDSKVEHGTLHLLMERRYIAILKRPLKDTLKCVGTKVHMMATFPTGQSAEVNTLVFPNKSQHCLSGKLENVPPVDSTSDMKTSWKLITSFPNHLAEKINITTGSFFMLTVIITSLPKKKS